MTTNTGQNASYLFGGQQQQQQPESAVVVGEELAAVVEEYGEEVGTKHKHD